MITDVVAVSQLSHVLTEAIVPAFLLAAIGTLITILTARLNRTIDRIRLLNAISKDDLVRLPLLAEIPFQMRRARILKRATYFAVGAAMTVAMLMLLSFIAAVVIFPHQIYAGVLFMLLCIQLLLSLGFLAVEVWSPLSSTEFYE